MTETFDQVFLGFSDAPGGGHLESVADIKAARRDADLLLSPEALTFVKLIVLHGLLPSEAYTQAFARKDEYDNIIKPEAPAYQARLLLKLEEVRDAIEEYRSEIREWTKTEACEIEMSYRSIMLDPNAKHSDRVAAGKALATLRGFDAVQPGLLAGATISINMGWEPKNLGGHHVQIKDIEGEVVK